jgi:hypothetical protein
MARPKQSTVFTEATGKMVEAIKYEENSDWQALEVAFSDGTRFSFEFSALVTVQASYLKARKGNLKLIRKYGRFSRPPGADT